MLLIFAVLVSVGLGYAPRWLGLYYLAVSVLSAAVYWWDKQRAIAGEWRVQETTLHFIDLIGGIVGGLMAQVAWRHKTAKPDFGMASAMIVIVQLCAIAALDFGVADIPGRASLG